MEELTFCSNFGAAKKLDKYLPAVDYFAKGLYMFDIGQNDLAGAFYSKPLDQVLASIPTILAEFEAGINVSFYFSLSENWAQSTSIVIALFLTFLSDIEMGVSHVCLADRLGRIGYSK